MNTTTELLVFFSGGLCLLRGINKLVEPDAGMKESTISVMCISIGLVNLQLYFFILTRSHVLYPVIGTLPVPFLKFLVGPALLFYVRSAFYQDETFRFSDIAHFVPAFASIALLIVIHLLCPMAGSFGGWPCDVLLLTRLRVWYDVVGYFLILGYLVSIAIDIDILSLLAGGMRDLESAIFAGIVVIMITIVVLIVGGHVMRSETLGLRAMQISSIGIILWSTVLARVPELERRVGRRVQEVRTTRKERKGCQPTTIVHRIEELMEKDRIYLNEAITLHSVAALIPTPSHQLSRAINDRYGMNFNAFVNTYRVREARRLIELKPGKSVLTVGYAVGFNSKSAFYNAFKREYGVSPGVYRTKNRS